jgi:hypothetical protein
LPAEAPTEARQEHRAGGHRRYASATKPRPGRPLGALEPPE